MATIQQATVFATGATGESSPDSLTLGNGVLWAEYGNGADSTGGGGSSTIVEYTLAGKVKHTYTIAGSADGLKIDPNTGMVYVLQNQDGNSTLSLIDPKTGAITGPLSYGVASATRGYDDVAFLNGQVYLSYTNPTGAGDPVLQRLVNGNTPLGTLTTTNILSDGATGFDISTGQANQPILLSDPDSLKTTPDGGLVLTSGADNAFTLISDPGTKAQSERFVQLSGLPAGSSLDDVIIPTSSAGTFYVTNSGTNQILSYKVTGLNTSDAYASVGTEIVQVDLQTGKTTPLITGLSASHGLAFEPTKVPGPVVQSTSIFALGSEVAGGTTTKPDSITSSDGSIWVEYGNTADSTGKKPVEGSSTIVQYSTAGKILHTYSLPGEIDGLKIDPATGDIWALKNQDANSFLYIINPTTHAVSGPLAYDSPYVYGPASSHGFDDVAFSGGKVFMSYSNPVNFGDPVIQQLDNGNSPAGKFETTPILRLGDTGKNLLTGQLNQPLPVGDPDSMKTLANGSLLLTSDNDPGLTIVAHPGTPEQSASFITFPAGTSGIDDAIMPTASAGTFYINNTGANDTLKVAVTGLNKSDIYVSIGSDNAIDQLDPKTGVLTPVITGLNGPAGLLFVPSGAGSAASTVADVMGDATNGRLPGLAQDLLPNIAAFGSAGTVAALPSGGSSQLSHQAFVASRFATDFLTHHA